MDYFDIKKFLTENKMTRNSRLLSEEFDAFTREELDALQQYEDTGMFPEWLSDEEGDALVAKWRAEYEDDFIDPAGGSGLYSHV